MSERIDALKYLRDDSFFESVVLPNIEKYRKGNASIIIKDSFGRAINNFEITVTQKSHEFKFGANIFMLDELETEEKNRLYKEYFKTTFNMATLPFYWNTLENKRGKPRYDKDAPKWYRRPPIDLCMEFCLKNDIEPREHGLAYENMFPEWLSNASISEIKEALIKRYEEISTRYADKIHTIEVTNEMDWQKGATPFYSEPDFIEWCFKKADFYFPGNQLVINEWTEAAWGDNCRTTDKYYAYTEAAKLKGCRIDAIGMQFHMFYNRDEEIEKSSYLYNPKSLYSHMDLYSNLAENLQVTEITIPAYSNDEKDEAIQAEILKRLFYIWFSHPKMDQIIYWNLVDGYAFVRNPTPEEIRRTQGNMTIGENQYYGGLLRFDLTPKPSYFMLNDLISKKWHTSFKLNANIDGRVDFRGFFGDYDIEIKLGDKIIKKEISLLKNKNNHFDFTV